MYKVIINLLLIFVLVACQSKRYGPEGFNDLTVAQPSEKQAGWFNKHLDASSLSVEQPDIVTWKLENGLQIYFLEDPELPLVSGQLIIPGGHYHAKQMDIGPQYTAMLSQLRTGGAGSLGPEALDQRLDELSAGISAGADSEAINVSFSCLSEVLPETFALFADVVMTPRFDESRLSLWKSRKVSSISRRKDEPDGIAGIAYKQLLYRNTPYQKIITTKDVGSITRVDLLKEHRKFIVPNGAKLILSGALNVEDAQDLIEQYFSAWEKSQTALPPLEEIKYQYQPGVKFIAGDFEQSTIYLVQPGPQRFGPNHYADKLFNGVFGSKGFASRLFSTVRSDMGLALSLIHI